MHLNSFDLEADQISFKNNSITPGTEFMFKLNQAMKFLIEKKMEEDDMWRKIKVVFSGSDVPGN